MKAVIDRFEEKMAVLLVGDKEAQVDFPKDLLPNGIKEGDWLKLTMEIDPEGKKKQKQKIEGLLNKLQNKNR